jgi:hypothetical protein
MALVGGPPELLVLRQLVPTGRCDLPVGRRWCQGLKSAGAGESSPSARSRLATDGIVLLAPSQPCGPDGFMVRPPRPACPARDRAVTPVAHRRAH